MPFMLSIKLINFTPAFCHKETTMLYPNKVTPMEQKAVKNSNQNNE